MKTIRVFAINPKILTKAKRLGVDRKLEKVLKILQENPFHRSLHTELLEPKSLGIWSFRVDRKIRAIFFWRDDMKAIEVINIAVHYH